jgi:heat shock protein HtpX
VEERDLDVPPPTTGRWGDEGMADLPYRWNLAWMSGGEFLPRRHAIRRHLKDFHGTQSAALFHGLLALLDCCDRIVTHGMRLTELQSGAAREFCEKASIWVDPLFARLGARRIGAFDFPAVYQLFRSLSRRAGLCPEPDLYWIPTATMNAFAIGRADKSAVAVTDGLLRNLTLEELAGILAHEIAHIRNGDASVMELAYDCTTAIELAALTGLAQLKFKLGCPRADVAAAELTMLLGAAPVIGRLLQSALSRIRELEADLDAVELAGDASGLARAIAKLERHHGTTGESVFASLGALFRSHPETPTRMRCLFAIA